MTNTTATAASTSTVPLARDPHGHPIAVPPEAAYWRVRRHTRGRPRNLSGPDRQPLKVPLDFTEEDLDNMLGAGTYRLDLCDAAGESLDVTATVELGEQEPANSNEQLAEIEAPSSLPVAASDVRLVLEANVRATQMAFLHNERTLVASLRMADTLREGIRDLASAQASWISSISSARGFFRNAPMAQLAASTEVERSSEPEVDDDDDESEEQQPMSVIDIVQPFVATITETVVKAVMGKKAPPTPSPTNGTAPATAAPAIKKNGFELRELLDWSYADRKAKARVAAEQAPPPPPDAEQATQMLIAKGKEIFARLDAPDRLRLMRLLPKLRERASEPAMQETVTKLAAMSPDEAATWVNQNLDDLEAKLAS